MSNELVTQPPDPLWTLHQGDCIWVLGRMPSGSVDLIVTDPPYESLEKHRVRPSKDNDGSPLLLSAGTTTRLGASAGSKGDWFPVFPDSRYPELFPELYRVLRAPAYLFIFCDEDTSDLLKKEARSAGFWFWNRITWVKTRKTMPSGMGQMETPAEIAAACVRAGMGYHGRRATEHVLMFEKRTRGQHSPWTTRAKPRGKGRAINDKSWTNVFFGPRYSGGANTFPTAKPPTLVRKLIEVSSDPGDVVLDPFCGGGVVGAEACSLGRRAVLVDVWDKAIEATRGALTSWPGRVLGTGGLPGIEELAPPQADGEEAPQADGEEAPQAREQEEP